MAVLIVPALRSPAGRERLAKLDRQIALTRAEFDVLVAEYNAIVNGGDAATRLAWDEAVRRRAEVVARQEV